MIKQYFQIKEQYPDSILMFRIGDFYEMFFDDAKLVSKELDLVLTGKNCGAKERAPMCGVPFHSADSYIARLVAKGYKVAVCEQLEDPALAKGLVKRDVARVLTPGTVIESSMLDESRNNFLACVCVLKDCVGLCFADVSTGDLHAAQFDVKKSQRKIINELGKFSPSEIIFNSGLLKLTRVTDYVKTRLNASCDLLDDSEFDVSKTAAATLRHFGKNDLSELSLENSPGAATAVGAALAYLKSARKTELENIGELDFYGPDSFMRLDVSTLANLEITETIRGGEKRGSLLWVLDKTKTSAGKRTLRSWLERPLMNIAKIIRRHNAVAELADFPDMRRDAVEELSGCQDLERLITRIIYSAGNARELRGLRSTLVRLPAIKEALKSASSAALRELRDEIFPLEELSALIDGAIAEDPPFSVREGGMIKDGFDRELDSLRDIVTNGKGYIADIQAREQERTGIKKLKIGFNRVFGYYIEVSNSFKELVPDDYERKQTLANCERFVTRELKELESKILGAQERINRLEYEIFDSVRKKASEKLREIQKTASALGTIDVLCSYATAATENGYCRPEMNEGDAIRIIDGRHPVVEKTLDAPFVPNDATLDCGENRCAVITGPNMAGKSTYMRQIALICLMAQAGSFVPASRAELCVVDGIFTRIGASDDLSSGSSTFMVEMIEVADILKNADSKSLIIFDEIGRGTSTFDGMSVAQAVLEHVSDRSKLGAKTLFATHYHELTELENRVEGIKNYNIAVKKRGDDLTFLRRIIRGRADGSYGVQAAKLAGVPKSVIDRAKAVLKEIEENGALKIPPIKETRSSEPEAQLSFDAARANGVVEELRSLDVSALTPIEALNVLYELVKRVDDR